MLVGLESDFEGSFLPQDSHTARFLFEELLKGPLLADRTVVSYHVVRR